MRNFTVGIVCEYDPFHNGHMRQINEAGRALPGAGIVCAMSGPFLQRGENAMFSPRLRAECALRSGADMVLEIPCAFAVREAERFALGGVHMLDAIGFVTHISFGCEADDIAPLRAAARLMEREGDGFRSAVRGRLDKGGSLAAAQGAALEEGLAGEGFIDTSCVRSPNNILAISYLRAIERLGSALVPLPVTRPGSYHSRELDMVSPSATAVRAALIKGGADAKRALSALPPQSARLVSSAVANGDICMPDALDTALLYRLREMPARDMAALPECTEGLENRLKDACRRATSREALLALLKTKRYTRSRLSRLLCHALLCMEGEEYPALPPYARLLGFRRDAADMLSLLPQSRIPIISKPADGPRDTPCMRLDERAYDAWALGAGQPAGLMMKSGVVVV